MPEKPLITIGITCYNAADTIQRAIESALAQDWDYKEIIVVDDVSSDSSCDIVEKLSQNHTCIQLIRHSVNTGPAGARNTILQNAKGAYIAFFDDDDESAAPRIRLQYRRLTDYERETGVRNAACFASGRRLYPNGYEVALKAIGTEPPIPNGTGMADRILFFGGPKNWNYGGTPTCSLMIPTDVLRALGGFDKDLRRVEDIDLAARLAMAGGHFIGCPENLFTQHTTWASDKNAEANLESELAIVEKHRAYLQSRGRYVYALQWPKIRYYHFKRNYPAMLVALAMLWLRHPLAVTRHFLTTGPARLVHELKMKRKSS